MLHEAKVTLISFTAKGSAEASTEILEEVVTQYRSWYEEREKFFSKHNKTYVLEQEYPPQFVPCANGELVCILMVAYSKHEGRRSTL